MLDIQGAQPALLTHGDCDKIADLHELGFAEMPMQALPQGISGRQVPCNGFGVGESRLLSFVVARRTLEVDQVRIVIFFSPDFAALIDR